MNLQIISAGLELNNEDIYEEGLELSEVICSSETLRFGAEASQINVRVRYSVPTMQGKTITAKLDNIPLGTFTIDEDKPNGALSYRDIVGFDLIYFINQMNFAEWYKGLSFPLSMTQFFNRFISYIEGVLQRRIPIKGTPTVNGGYLFDNSIQSLETLEELSGERILNDFANATASFIRCSRDNMIEFVSLKKDEGLYPATILYPKANLYPRADSMKVRLSERNYINCTYEDYLTKKVERVQIIKSDGDIGVYSGTGANTYTISENIFLMQEDTEKVQTACDNIFNAIKDIEYTPCNIETEGNLDLLCGDLIAFNSHGTTHKTYILQRTIKGIQFLKDTLVAEGNEEISETDNSLRNQVIKLNGKSNVLKVTLDATISELTDFEGETSSKFEQTAQSISAKVSKEGGSSSFSWELLDDHFSLKSNDKEVFKCNSDGVKINGYVDADTFDGVSAKIGAIEADNVLIHGELNAQSVTVGGIDGRVTTIEGDYVTTGTLNAHTIDADKITSGTIQADRLSGDVIAGKLAGKEITCNALNANTGLNAPATFSFQSKSVSWLTITINGTSYSLLGSR